MCFGRQIVAKPDQAFVELFLRLFQIGGLRKGNISHEADIHAPLADHIRHIEVIDNEIVIER